MFHRAKIGIAGACKGRLLGQSRVIERECAGHVDRAAIVRARELPSVERPGRAPIPNARKAKQVIGVVGDAVPRSDRRRRDDTGTKRWPDRRLRHISRNDVINAEAGVESSRNDVQEPRIGDKIDAHFGIGLEEGEQDRFEDAARAPPIVQVSRNVPLGSSLASAASVIAMWSSRSAGWARARNRSPAAVSATLRVVRAKSCTPSRSYNAAMVRLESGWRHP